MRRALAVLALILAPFTPGPSAAGVRAPAPAHPPETPPAATPDPSPASPPAPAATGSPGPAATHPPGGPPEPAGTPSPTPRPAGKKDGFGRCPAKAFCVFDKRGGHGRMAALRRGARTLSLYRMDRRTGSVRNNTARRWCLFAAPHYQGRRSLAVNAGKSEDITGEFDNRVRSLRPENPQGWCWP
ncbi:peptidase inhibitor family I36 protein [Bailinhaonella thermotolerans]|uniref:Uncharacterized protein n=1 Tax=Bailinhaonella thermotolerans TaxID=1070861 RepID=A0A3A4AJI8_9ACTN|nr:peptidase inhibitor family I36 protein [Bailinhaonella thermotolerans]RJL27244.1 hypothetical protein D5H75_26000 [Bailinhaonella thermotolerans]